ncbi:MAG: hypothetical protein Q9218_007146 [Villophora microphyllina]
MTQDGHSSALAMLDDLQYRLQRIEFVLSGSDNPQKPLEAVVSKGRDHTITARLASLERKLSSMSEQSPIVHDLLQLRTFSPKSCWLPCIDRLLYATEVAHPTLFHPSKAGLEAIPSTLSTEEILAIVTAHAPLYPQTASRLTSIHDMNIPSSSLSATLISLQPRIAKLQQLQDAQAREIAALRARSARVVQRWYELGVLGQGECWAEWEGRMEECEKRMRRLEGEKRREVEERGKYLG